MPETPDFDAIATRVASYIPSLVTRERVQHEIVEHLRVMWNARGAADIVKLEATFEEWKQPSMKTLDHALRSLDR